MTMIRSISSIESLQIIIELPVNYEVDLYRSLKMDIFFSKHIYTSILT